MEKVRRQHYVPRMYLKRFGYGNKDNEYITVLKLDDGTVMDNRKVENFAVANYFYDTNKEQLMEILKEDLEIFSELCDSEELLDEQFTEHTLANEEAAISNMLSHTWNIQGDHPFQLLTYLAAFRLTGLSTCPGYPEHPLVDSVPTSC